VITTVELEVLAKQYRRSLFEKFLTVRQGHPGSTFSMIDIVVALYHGGFVRFDSEQKKFLDRVLISKGHATVALYPILAQFGVLPQSEWDAWGKSPSALRVFGNKSIPGIDVTSGSLGHGVGVGAGMALAFKRSESDKRVFVVISEGELYEGSTWEALLFSAHYSLSNLTIVVDINSLIILGSTGDCLSLNPIQGKLAGLGLEIRQCDGHDFASLMSALSGQTSSTQPLIVLANTVKGKGFSIMEHKASWHYWNPMTVEQIEQCRRELA
jgi:transketolase